MRFDTRGEKVMKKNIFSKVFIMLLSLLLAIAIGTGVLIIVNIMYSMMGKAGVLTALLGGACVLGIVLLVIDYAKKK